MSDKGSVTNKDYKIRSFPSIRSVLLFLFKNKSVTIAGADNVKCSVPYGTVSILGFKMSSGEDIKSYNLFAPHMDPAITFSHVEDNEDKKKPVNGDIPKPVWQAITKMIQTTNNIGAIIYLVQEKKVFQNSPLRSEFVVKDTSIFSHYESSLNLCIESPNTLHEAYTIPEAWESLKNDIVNFKYDGPKSTSVMAIGAKNTGKSTFSRFIINSFLNLLPKVAYLECDLGQPLFNPPGLIALHVLTDPTIVTNFCSLLTPFSAIFTGDIKSSDKPTFYLQSIITLYERYIKSVVQDGVQNVPLIINTPGWVLGMGLDLLTEITKCVQPTFFIQFKQKNQPLPIQDPNAFFSLANYVPKVLITLPSAVTKPRKINAKYKRESLFLSYFKVTNERLGAQITYKVPWNVLRIRFLNDQVPPSQVLYALNGVMVGLSIDEKQYVTDKIVDPAISSLYPQFLLTSPICECVGMAEESKYNFERKCEYNSCIHVNRLLCEYAISSCWFCWNWFSSCNR
eukprot:TRINITY_DN3394_c0_g1_i6.p1 TRINITY_DN3394_c0_g1~~TRINITY_DN3394_c0_g1_i6.p1  ORF type:complete len:523 (+),score=58.83 TRINITY_DN3394_c0_g1_i6:42-1571(+)